MTTRPIDGRTVCVTGASSGIGRAIAEHLGGLGAHVFLTGRTTEPMEESAEKIVAAGGRAEVAAFDVTDHGALQGWVQGALNSSEAMLQDHLGLDWPGWLQKGGTWLGPRISD